MSKIITGRFRFFKVDADLLEVYEKINDPANQACLTEDKGGFSETSLYSDYVGTYFREIIANEILVLEDGKFVRKTVYQVDDAFFAIFKKFAIVFGKPAAVKIGSFTIAKHTGVEFRAAAISPKRLFDLSDHMSQIKRMKFAKMKHPVYRGVVLDGAMETAAEIAPFNEYMDNLQIVKGVMNTPEGVRTLSFDVNGCVSVSKKKDEELSPELVTWIYKLVYGAAKVEDDPAVRKSVQEFKDAVTNAGAQVTIEANGKSVTVGGKQ